MPWVRLPAIVVLCALPCAVSAQQWKEAYAAGNYEKAADLLHPIVTHPDIPAGMEPEPFEMLAGMYAKGLGVTHDPIAACALAGMAHNATWMQPFKPTGNPVADVLAYETSRKSSEQFMALHCSGLSMADRSAAGRSMGCYAFGMPEETLMLGKRPVRVGRAGIHLEDAADGNSPGLVNCPILVGRVRARTVRPPQDAAPGVDARHLLELFAWQVGGEPARGSPVYLLQWHVYELRGNSLMPITMTALSSDSRWPRPAFPADVDTRLTLEMIRSGHVRWRFEDKPPKRGWLMLPDEPRQ